MTLIALAATIAAAAFVFVGSASAAPAFGVSILKDCVTPINVGDAYSCEFEISNTVQSSGLTVTTKTLTDTVFAAGGNQTFSEPLNNTVSGLIFTGGASCDATQCTVPFGGSITTPFISHYDAQVGDFPSLADQGGFVWNEVCGTFPGCSTRDNNGITSASADINPIPTTTTTSINSGGLTDVTAVAAGSSVTDSVTVSNNIGNQPPATGNVTVNFYGTLDCSGQPLDTASTDALDSNGQALNVHPEGPLAAGLYGYQATYLGSADGAYSGSTGACEPLRVVDANIQISPANATNATGTNHVLTGHVNVNDGSGFANAPDGTVIHFSLANAGGATATFVGPSSCTTSGGTGSCTVTISSPTTGTTSINDTTTLSVAGVSLTRSSGDANAGDGPAANKSWVDANIQISPPTAANEIGTNHVLTITVNALNGTLDAGPHTATASILSGPGGFVGSPSCTYVGGGASASCTVTISSAVTGQTVVQATSNIPVSGQTISRTTGTNPGPGGSGNAEKSWVDANIQITPATATDPVGDNHTLTGHVNVNDGSGAGYVNAPDGTVISFSLTNSGGATATFVGPSSCTTAGGTGSCSVIISSPTAGTTTIHASTTVSVLGVLLTRATDGGGANSGDAQKIWINPDANIQISPQSAQDPVGDTHTLTGHVNVAPDGVTFSNAPDGTLITFSIVSGPGSFVGGVNTCTTTGGTGSCTVQITSAVAGTTVIRAATDVTVSGVSLHRETNDNHTGDSSDANKTWIPPGGIIAPTQTSCSDVLNGTFATLGQINYSLSGGKIGQGINPGVFFYYAKITTTTTNQVVTVSQSNTSTNSTPLFQALNGQAWLWKGDCSSHTVGALTGGGSGASFTVPTPGNYIIGIKYSTKSIAGAPAPVPATLTYNFVSSLGSSTAASVLLKKQ